MAAVFQNAKEVAKVEFDENNVVKQLKDLYLNKKFDVR